MNQNWADIKQRFDELDQTFRTQSSRERALLTLLAVGISFFALDQLLLQPVSEDRSRTQQGIAHSTDAIEKLEGQLRAIGQVHLSEDERRALDEKKLIETQIAEIENQLSETVASMVPPKAIVSVLEELLEETQGLRLVRLVSHAPKKIGTPEKYDGSEQATDPSVTALYRHGLSLEIEGDYLSTLDYLQRIESSSWNLLWERLEYRVETFPRGRIRIQLNTISNREEWIGV